MRRSALVAIVAAFALLLAACDPEPTGSFIGPLDFEDAPYTLGTIDGQDGWQSDGANGGGCGFPYDHEVDDEADSGTTPGAFGFGDQSLRISNAITSGCFDGTYSKETVDYSGETAAPVDDQHSGGVRRGYFESSWSFATAGNPFAVQDDLYVVAAPDRGDGARMSWIEMQDCSATIPPDIDECQSGNPGLEVNFFEYDEDAGDSGDFVFTNVANGLSRFAAHDIRIRMWFYEGRDNDAVEVCVDGTICVTGGSWEDYYRDVEENPTRPVDSVGFHTRSGAELEFPDNAGNGFFIDNFKVNSVTHTGADVVVSGPSNVIEGNAGSTLATYTITLSEPLPITVNVPYNTSNGTATAPSDYTATSGTAIFAPGETVKTVDVPINGDASDESHESFTFNLGPPTTAGRESGAASGGYVFRHVSNKSTSIRDDDSTIRVSDGSATEPDSGSALMPFTFTLDNPSAVPVTVQYSTANGSAVAPGDYAARTNVTITFSPGQTSKVSNVAVKADALVEGNENFLVNLHSPSNGVIADGVGAGVIDDADD